MKKAALSIAILIQAVLLSALLIGVSFAQAPEPPHGIRATPPVVYSQGQVTIKGTWSCDLDLGNQVHHTNPARDFQWDHITWVERYLAPKNGAQFHVIGAVDFNSIGYTDLQGYTYSSDEINGSDDASNQIPAGTVLGAITNQGRYSKFRIDTYGYNLTITWLTYDKTYYIYLPLAYQN